MASHGTQPPTTDSSLSGIVVWLVVQLERSLAQLLRDPVLASRIIVVGFQLALILGFDHPVLVETVHLLNDHSEMAARGTSHRLQKRRRAETSDELESRRIPTESSRPSPWNRITWRSHGRALGGESVLDPSWRANDETATAEYQGLEVHHSRKIDNGEENANAGTGYARWSTAPTAYPLEQESIDIPDHDTNSDIASDQTVWAGSRKQRLTQNVRAWGGWAAPHSSRHSNGDAKLEHAGRRGGPPPDWIAQERDTFMDDERYVIPDHTPFTYTSVWQSQPEPKPAVATALDIPRRRSLRNRVFPCTRSPASLQPIIETSLLEPTPAPLEWALLPPFGASRYTGLDGVSARERQTLKAGNRTFARTGIEEGMLSRTLLYASQQEGWRG